MEQAWSWPNKGQNQLGLLVRFRWGQFRTRSLIRWCQRAGDKVHWIGKVNMGQRHTQVASQAFVGGAERRHQSVDSTLGESERETPPQCLTVKKHFFTKCFIIRVGTMTHVQEFIFLTGKKTLPGPMTVALKRSSISTSLETSSTGALIPLPLGLNISPTFPNSPWRACDWGLLPFGHICITKYAPSQSNR